MMRVSILFGTVLAMLWSLAEAQVLKYQEDELPLRDKARACWMAFVKLYDAEYYRSEDGAARCVKLDYLRDFERQELVESTEKIFGKLHGDDSIQQFAEELSRVTRVYAPVGLGSSYEYCVGATGVGEMIREGRVVVRLDNPEFSERFMNIWVVGEEADGKPRWNFSRCPGTLF